MRVSGAMGIVGVKNLIEEGFHVTGFDKSDYVGGLWHYTDEKDTLSVLPCEDQPTSQSHDGC